MMYVKNASMVLIAQFAIMAVGFLSRPLIARFLGPTEYGYFALVLAVSAIVPAFNLFAVNQATLYFSSKNPKNAREVLSSAFTITIILSLVFCPAFLLVLPYLLPTIGITGAILAICIGIGASILLLTQAYCQAIEDFKTYSLLTAGTAVFAAISSVALAYFFRNFFSTSIGRVIPLLALPIITLLAIKALKINFTWSNKLLKYALPIGLTGLFGTFIALVDRYVISIYRTPADVGFYDIAYSFTAAVLPVTAAIATIVAPKMANTTRIKEKLEKTTAVTTAISCVGAILLFYYADFLVSILLGAKYVEGATTPIRIIALALPFMSLVSVYGAIVANMGHTKFASLISLVIVGASILFNIILVPAYGIIGAGYANLVTYMITFLLFAAFFAVKKYSKDVKAIATYVGLVAFCGVYWLVASYGFIAKTAMLAVFTAILVWTNKGIAKSILNELKEIARGVYERNRQMR